MVDLVRIKRKIAPKPYGMGGLVSARILCYGGGFFFKKSIIKLDC